MNRRRGSTLLETVMFAPVLIVLLLGMTEMARVIYTYYTLQKMMYTLARYVGTQQGVNFCNDADPAVVAAKNLALTGSTDGGNALVSGVTSDLVAIRIERYSPDGNSIAQCDCSSTGCDAAQGGLPPDFVVAEIPNGFSVRPLFFKLTVDPFLLKPHVRVPYGGT